MKRLSPIEENAVRALRRKGSFVPDLSNPRDVEAARIFDGLVKKKRVQTEVFDSSVKYTLTMQGEADAS